MSDSCSALTACLCSNGWGIAGCNRRSRPKSRVILFAVIFLIGAAYTLKHDRHVRVDVLYMKFSKKYQAWINFLGCIIFLIPFSILVIWASQKFVMNSFKFQEISPDPGGLPARYILKACVPLGFFLILLQGFSLMFRSLLTILDKGKNEE